jgi:hypothetical protein
MMALVPPQVGQGIPIVDLMGQGMEGRVSQGIRNAVSQIDSRTTIQIQRDDCRIIRGFCLS